jgi:hypothetical protein
MPDVTDATAGIVIESDEEGFTPTDVSISSHNKPVNSTGNTSSALDSLLGEVSPEATPEVEEAEEKAPVKEAEKAPVKEAPKAPVKEATKEPVKEEPTTKPKIDVVPKPEVKDEPADKLKEVQLPPHAKPASYKAFDEIKRVAREEIAAVRKELDEVKTKLPKEGQKILDPQIEKELEDLRAFRAAHDYTRTPEFEKNFVTPIAENETALFAKLKQVGFTDEKIAEVKKIGVDRLDWDAVFEKLPQTSKLSLQSLLLTREQLNEKKIAEEGKAKAAPTEYAKKQQEVSARKQAEEQAEVLAAAGEVLDKVDWLKEKTVPVDATEEQRKQLETDNTFVREQKARYDALLKDRSGYTHGALVSAAIAAYQFRRDLDAFKTRAETAEAELAKVKKASSTARAARSAPPPGRGPAKPFTLIKHTGDALDELRAQVEGAQE